MCRSMRRPGDTARRHAKVSERGIQLWDLDLRPSGFSSNGLMNFNRRCQSPDEADLPAWLFNP